LAVGYFSLFDLGLGRALTKLTADKLGSGKPQEIPPLASSALTLMLVLGVITGLAIFVLSRILATKLFNIPQELMNEAIGTFQLLSIATPIIIVTAGLRGILEAFQKFAWINVVRIPLGAATYALPLAVLLVVDSIPYIVLSLLVIRFLTLAIYLKLVRRIVPRITLAIDRKELRPLLSFGGWLTISNFIGPVLVYADRFFVASLVSISALAYYTTPYEIVSKLYVIPIAILGVLFPAFAELHIKKSPNLLPFFHRTLIAIFTGIGLLVSLIVGFSELGLSHWLGPEFSTQSAHVTQILAIGILINVVGITCQTFVQALGKPSWTAMLHITELPLYLLYLYYLVDLLGIVGAASAWVIRATLSTLVLLYMASWLGSHQPYSHQCPRSRTTRDIQ
jgi:O-antigen/teichoic acid export membrane protein